MDSSDLVTSFRGERYRATERLGALIAPPYDVITPERRARYAAWDSHNIVHLTLPEALQHEDRYARAAALLTEWRQRGVLVTDPEASVYLLAQDYDTPDGVSRTRLGVFAAVAAEAYETGRVKRHEKTHSGPKSDRLALLRATRTNLESIFVLAPDTEGALAAELDLFARTEPTARAELDGVRMRMWVLGGAAASRIAALASRSSLYIADGHHRYETAVQYAQENPAATHVLALIVSARDSGLTILPTHRVIYGQGRDPTALVEGWRRWFDVGRVAPCADRVERLAELGARGAGTACIVALPDAQDLTLVLRPDAQLDGLPSHRAVRSLDVAIVEELVVKEILRSGASTPTLTYTADAREAFDAVRKGNATCAVILNPPKVEQVFAVADAGEVMPPKSTYFVPKVPSGLVLRPLG
jgi:uncharacterized protein (DUF1015 family)